MQLITLADLDLCLLQYTPHHHPGFLLPCSPHEKIDFQLNGYIDVNPYGTPDMRQITPCFCMNIQEKPVPGCIFRLSLDHEHIEVYSIPLDYVVVKFSFGAYQKCGGWIGVILERFVNMGQLDCHGMFLFISHSLQR